MEGDQPKQNPVMPEPAPAGQPSSLAPIIQPSSIDKERAEPSRADVLPGVIQPPPSANQAAPIQPASAPAQPEQPKKISLLRTMKSDTEEIFKTSHPSLSQMIGPAGSG